MAKKIGVLLSGCGYLDGAEIHEATLTLYFLDKAGAEITCMAPDKEQADVIDHQAGEPHGGPRNVLRSGMPLEYTATPHEARWHARAGTLIGPHKSQQGSATRSPSQLVCMFACGSRFG